MSENDKTKMNGKKKTERHQLSGSENWPLKNLRFLFDFMRRLNLSTQDIAEAVGLNRPAIVRWFYVDDTQVGRIHQIADHYGLEVTFAFEVPRDEENPVDLKIELPAGFDGADEGENKKLTFIRKAMDEAGMSIPNLAEKIGLTANPLRAWFVNDDTSISNVVSIAKNTGWRLIVEFHPKKKEN